MVRQHSFLRCDGHASHMGTFVVWKRCAVCEASLSGQLLISCDLQAKLESLVARPVLKARRNLVLRRPVSNSRSVVYIVC